MDIALEIVDYFVGDAAYAKLLPAPVSSFGSHGGLHNASQLTSSQWKYEPSTYLFHLEPSAAAYESAWARDNIYRQAITLFFLTWSVPKLLLLQCP